MCSSDLACWVGTHLVFPAFSAHVPVFVVEAPVISCPGAHCSPHESHISPEQLRVARNVPCVHVVQAPADVGDANGLNEPASQHFHGWHSEEPFALVNDATHALHAAALPWRSRGLKVPTSHSTHPEEPGCARHAVLREACGHAHVSALAGGARRTVAEEQAVGIPAVGARFTRSAG